MNTLQAEQPINPDKKGKFILYIDDDEDDTEFFRLALTSVDKTIQYQALTCGLKALQALREKNTLPDIIILDLNMPKISGFDILREIKTRRHIKDIPVFILSTSTSTKDMEQANALGASAFFSKPNTFKELCTLIRNML